MIEGRQSGLMSKQIATITRFVPLDDVSLEDCRLGDMSGAREIFQKLNLRSLLARLNRMGVPGGEAEPAA